MYFPLILDMNTSYCNVHVTINSVHCNTLHMHICIMFLLLLISVNLRIWFCNFPHLDALFHVHTNGWYAIYIILISYRGQQHGYYTKFISRRGYNYLIRCFRKRTCAPSEDSITKTYSYNFFRGGSNEYPQSMFLSRNKKDNVYPCKPQFYYIKVGVKGVKII